MRVAAAVSQVAEAHAHVVGERTGQGDGEADAKDGVGERKGVQIAVVQEEQAGNEPPDQRHRGQDGAGHVGEREDGCGGERGERGPPRQKPQKTYQEDVLQEELLEERPEGISPVALEKGEWRGRGMQGVEVEGDQDRCACEQQRRGADPQ